jgi:hypothetical protein
MEDSLHFDADDLRNDLPAPGCYRGTVATARHRTSAAGNPMIQVVYELEGVVGSHARVSEYFAFGGSERGQATARRKLAGLYRACGLAPKGGDAIDPADLLGARLEIRVEHDEWQGERRLRVASHRSLEASGRTPF